MSNTCRICLNMIVKNESKIITRLFDSVLPLIDSYCICDTGSTDDTIQIIKEYFHKKEIPGKIIQIPFQDFGYNRTQALQVCNDMLDIDYILLIDADMMLRIPEKVSISDIKSIIVNKPAHYLFQGCDKFYYRNIRIVKKDMLIHIGV